MEIVEKNCGVDVSSWEVKILTKGRNLSVQEAGKSGPLIERIARTWDIFMIIAELTTYLLDLEEEIHVAFIYTTSLV
jgi:hypothetical protein